MKSQTIPKSWYLAQILITVTTFFKKFIPKKLKREIQKIIDPPHIKIEYKRAEKYFYNYVDLVGKQCEVFSIEKYLVGLWLVYFNCENEIYLVVLNVSPITENQKLLLKSKCFKFVRKGGLVMVQSDEESAELATQTSIKVRYIDHQRGLIGIYEYAQL